MLLGVTGSRDLSYKHETIFLSLSFLFFPQEDLWNAFRWTSDSEISDVAAVQTGWVFRRTIWEKTDEQEERESSASATIDDKTQSVG